MSLVDHPERLRAARRRADRVLIFLQRANDHREHVRLVIDHQDVKAALRDGRLERGRRDKRLQGRSAAPGRARSLRTRRRRRVPSRIAVPGRGPCARCPRRSRSSWPGSWWVSATRRTPAAAAILHHVVVRAVSPGLLRAVLLGRVLGVVDHEIGVGHESGVPAVSVVQDGLDVARLGTGAPELVGERLVIHQVHHRHAVGFDAVARASWPGD